MYSTQKHIIQSYLKRISLQQFNCMILIMIDRHQTRSARIVII
jgi:hypothetical protein